MPVTSLPTSPKDRDLMVFQADATNGIYWTFRYRAASGSSYKWEFLGGSPLWAEVSTSETTTSSVFTDLATTGPSVTVPLAGDYDVTIGCSGYSASSALNRMSYAIGGTAASVNDNVLQNAVSFITGSRKRRQLALATSTALVSKYRNDSAVTGTWANRFMEVTPVRVG